MTRFSSSSRPTKCCYATRALSPIEGRHIKQKRQQHTHTHKETGFHRGFRAPHQPGSRPDQRGDMCCCRRLFTSGKFLHRQMNFKEEARPPDDGGCRKSIFVRRTSEKDGDLSVGTRDGGRIGGLWKNPRGCWKMQGGGVMYFGSLMGWGTCLPSFWNQNREDGVNRKMFPYSSNFIHVWQTHEQMLDKSTKYKRQTKYYGTIYFCRENPFLHTVCFVWSLVNVILVVANIFFKHKIVNS